MNIKIFNNFDEDLKKIWIDFQKKAFHSVFQSYDWLYYWQKLVGNILLNSKPKIVVVEKNGEVILMLPFCIQKRFGIKILYFLGGINTDYKDPIVKKGYEFNKEDFFDLWNNIKKRIGDIDFIHLEPFNNKIFTTTNPFTKYFKCKSIESNFKINLKNLNWREFYENKVSSKSRETDRRKLKKIKNFGDCKFNICNSENERKELLETMIEQKEKRFKNTRVFNFFKHEEYKNLYKNLINFNDQLFQTHYSSITVDKEIIACHIGFIFKNDFYYLMASHKSEWQKYSPGKIILHNLIKWCINNKIKNFDFTVGNEDFKEQWSNEKSNLYSYTESITNKGKIYNFLRLINKIYKK